MALDRVNHRMFIPEPGNIRILVYQLDEQGVHIRPTADRVIGHHHLMGRRRLSEVNERDTGTGGRPAFDDRYQRLFVGDGSFGGPPGSRILVFDASPDRLQDHPAAVNVIGQPDFRTRTPGGGRRKFGGGNLIVDSEHQRLFVRDNARFRILVFDIHPDRLTDFPEAALVIGQPDFETYAPGAGARKWASGSRRGSGLALDGEHQRLFVADPGNHRILIFDVHPERLENFPEAVAVLGQPDFETRESRFAGVTALPGERRGLKSITPGGLGYDGRHRRLFVTQNPENRILVFNVDPRRPEKFPEAVVVLGQPDFETLEPRVSRSRFAFPKDPVIDSDKQLLYVSEGFPGGNRVIAIDVSPENLKNGAPAVDVIGHIDDEGRSDFRRRMANDRLDGRTATMARAVALDPVDHRLFVADEYNNRVLGFQLDGLNRLLERKARWIFGQKDAHTASVSRTRTGMAIPLAVAYEEVDKRLYVGDGWNDRILIYDLDPARLEPGGNQPAAVVLGQAGFETQDPRAARDRLDFAVDGGRGIASRLLPMGIAFDSANRRAFISDGGNNRILVFDIEKSRLRNGAEAIGVLGQSDFTSREARLAADGLNSPGHLAYDPDHHRLMVVDSLNERVLVFDAAAEKFRNGMAASYVIGQPDFETTTPPRELRSYGTVPDPQSIPHPNGIAYDRVKQRLYVTDRGNDRIVVFDAAPERMTSHPYALAVLGQRSEESHAEQVVADMSAQDQLYDPRGIAFDSDNQQLYVMDSHWARMVLFSFPQDSRKVEVPSRGVRSFSTLDPYLAYNPVQARSGVARFPLEGGTAAAFALTRTRFERDPVTERQSRILLGQAYQRVAAPVRRALLFADGRTGARTQLQVSNAEEHPVTVRFELHAGSSSRRASRLLQPGAQLSASVAELFETSSPTGAVTVQSDSPVSLAAWNGLPNRHGEETVAPVPILAEAAQDSAAFIVALPQGAAFRSDIVLLNPHPSEASGMIVLRDEDGREVQSHHFSIQPGGFFLQALGGESAVPRSRYAVVTGSRLPAAAALVRHWDEGLVSQSVLEAAAPRRLAVVAVDTMPDPIRHGRSTRARFTVANPNPQGAAVRFILRDLQGREVDRHEQLVAGGLQRSFSLGDLFNRVQFAGSVTVASDLPVGVSARIITTNLRGEDIFTELPVMAPSSLQGSSVAVAVPVRDGKGVSTKLSFVSLADQGSKLEMVFFGPEGRRLPLILR